MPRLSLLLIFQFSTAIFVSFAANTASGQQALIKGFKPFGQRAGVVYTDRSVFRTFDGGKHWQELELPQTDGEKIADILFLSRQKWIVFVANGEKGAGSILYSADGGNGWTRREADLTSVIGTEAYLENGELAVLEDGVVELRFPVPTSSNFVGRSIFRSFDGGVSWNFVSLSIVANTESDSSSVKSEQNWRLETEGKCFGFKSGCLQQTRLFISGREATPPELRDLAAAEAESAQQSAIANGFTAPGGSTRISLGRGFDKCQNASVAAMQIWWDNSPYFDANIYFSGRNRACSQTISASWVNQVSAMGWGLIPTVVGYQSPCTASTTSAKFSLDPVTAEQQGRGEANIAVADAANIGLAPGSVLYYDMERYDETVSTPGCRTATVAFLKGWTERLHELGYVSGVYGSPTNAVNDWWPMSPSSRMDAIWMARWDNVMSVWVYSSPSPAFPAGAWENHQRIKQWQAPHNETWGGITFNIDGNIADGPVAAIPFARNRNADFDGDGKTDLSVFRPGNGTWWVAKSSDGGLAVAGFGTSADVLAPADFDGDGKTDFAVFRPENGFWYSLGKAGTFAAVPWGTVGDVPVPADYNGDGRADRAVFRPSTGVWYIANSDSRSTVSIYQWGISGDKPVPCDYDGDGKTDLAVFRPSNGVWYIWRSSDGVAAIYQWGITTDQPVQADYDGDGKCDVAIFRNGQWWINGSTDGPAVYFFGLSGDIPSPGYYDASPKADLAVYRPSSGIWYLMRDVDGFGAIQFGVETDRSVPNAYFPQ